MYLLDTNTLSHLWDGHALVTERLEKCDEAEVAITSITKAEILRGRLDQLLKAADAAAILVAQERLDRTELLLARRLIIPFETMAARQLDELRRIKKLKKIGLADVLIASIAIANDATLVTRNLKDFRQVPRLKVENWVD